MLLLKKQNKTTTDLEYALLDAGYKRVVGIDEAGRGCWAGPVAVGAYIFDLKSVIDPQVTDSKLIKENKRLEIFQKYDPRRFFVTFGSAADIDAFGIGKVITLKIKDIIARYNTADTFFIIDGQFSLNFGSNTQKIIKGDLKHYAIASASIAAKVSRDLLMYELAKQYPEYNFGKHKGYGTAEHLDMLKIHGVCAEHRLSFAPMKYMANDLDSSER